MEVFTPEFSPLYKTVDIFYKGTIITLYRDIGEK